MLPITNNKNRLQQIYTINLNDKSQYLILKV